MRLLVFSELFYPHGSGAELATWLYLKLLADKGFKITVITRQFTNEPSAELINNRITVFRLPLNNMMIERKYDTLVNIGVMASSFVNKLMAESDVIYIPAGWYSVIPLAKIHKKPVVVHLHNYIITCPTSFMYNFAKREIGVSSSKSFMIHEMIQRKNTKSVLASSLMNELLGKHYCRLGSLADAIIFVSNAQADLVLSKIPQLKEKSYQIYNPLPDRPLINAESKGVGYFGGKRFDKGFLVLKQALKSNLLKYPGNFELFMTNTAQKHKTIKTSNGDVVNFLPRLTQNTFLDLMKKLSVVVIPSLWPEPLPYNLSESMLYGKLIVASRIGGMPEMLSGVSSGVKLIEPGDSDELLAGLSSFLTLNLAEINEMGIKNRRYIMEKFDNELAVTSFIKVLDGVV